MKKMLFLSLSIIVVIPQIIKTFSDNDKKTFISISGLAIVGGLIYFGYNKYQGNQEQQRKDHEWVEKSLHGEQLKKEQELELKRQQEGKEQAQQEALEMLKKEDALRKQQKEEQIVIMLSKQLAEENKKIKQEEAAILAVKNQKWDDFMQELYEVLV